MSDPALHADHEAATDLKGLVELISRALVDEPESVSVREIAGQRTSVYELSVAKSDIGKIVGKGGGNLRALEVILAAVGSKLGRKAAIEIVE